MSIKDLFDVRIKTFQKQHDNLNGASVGAESIEYIKEKQKLKDLYVHSGLSTGPISLNTVLLNYIMILHLRESLITTLMMEPSQRKYNLKQSPLTLIAISLSTYILVPMVI